jgi:protein TonB
MERRSSSRDPLERVLGLGAKATTAITVSLIIALLAHGTAVARTAYMSIELLRWSKVVQGKIAERLVEEYDVEVSKPVDAPPPPEPPQEKAPAPAPLPKAPIAPEEPPPQAAQAGKVLTAEPDPNDPVDLTGGGFVSGSGTSYAGGVTQASGTGKTAVYNPAARATGVPGGTGTAPLVAAGPDRSRGAGLSGASEWKCPWPAEAEAEQIDEAFVKVQVAVGIDGKASKVSVLSDPGHGFAREAQRCAMRESFAPALDHDGTPVAGTTKVLKIHFER